MYINLVEIWLKTSILHFFARISDVSISEAKIGLLIEKYIDNNKFLIKCIAELFSIDQLYQPCNIFELMFQGYQY